MKQYIIMIVILLTVNIYQYKTHQNTINDVELEQTSKDWWYGAAVGCMEGAGYWNESKQKTLDRNESWIFEEGRTQAIKTIQSLDSASRAFKSKCDNLYGINNWTEYGADYIDFVLGSNHPIYFKDGHSITCFKTGTTP